MPQCPLLKLMSDIINCKKNLSCKSVFYFKISIDIFRMLWYKVCNINFMFKFSFVSEGIAMTNKQFFEGSFFLNRDPDWACEWWFDSSSKEAMQKSFEFGFDKYASEAVTDVALNIFAQGSYIPSEVFPWKGDDYLACKESHPAWSERFKPYYLCHAEYGLDPVQIFIDQTSKNGRRPWISIRMNDCHKLPVYSKFHQEEQEAGHILGEEYGYSWNCIDYKYPRYREYLLRYFEELLQKYDFFGLELDFLREARCFRYNHDTGYDKIMTEFIRQVRALTKKYEERVGHEIKLLIRLPRDIKTCMDFGFDVKTMIAEKLVDVINPSARWAPTESAIPVREWLEAAGDDVAVIPGIEELNGVEDKNDRLFACAPPHAKAYLASFYGQGAPGVYIYNYFGINWVGDEVWTFNEENPLKGLRKFIVNEQDRFVHDETRYKPFPFVFEGERVFPIEVGKIKATDKVDIIIDYIGDKDNHPTLTANDTITVKGKRCEHVTIINHYGNPYSQTKNIVIEYDISGIETPSTLNLKFHGNGTIVYLQANIDAR